MLFWKSSSSSSSSAATTPARATPSTTVADTPPSGSQPPSYILSEQRRRELLLAARANRVSWIDGSAAVTGSSAAGEWAAPHARVGSSIPPQCQQALEAVAADLQTLVGSLDELKRQIIPNSLLLSSSSSPDDVHGEKTQYRTVFQDLFEHDALLRKWLRTQGHEIASPVRRKRLTGDDREMVFLLAFRELIAVLKNPRAAELVYQIQSFVKRFDTAWDLKLMLRQRAARERPGGHVQAFVDKLVQQLRHNDKLLEYMDLSGDNDDDATEFLGGTDEWSEDLLHEVLEAFLMEKVYAKALTPTPQAEHEDRMLHERLQSLAFVDFHHLDLPTPDTEESKRAWHQLVLQLQQLTLYMSPRRKMDCVLRVCRDLTKLLASQRADGRLPSADEFLPGLIYLLLKANPSELKRNVNYILEYRNPSKLVSEPGYFFTHLVSSVAFLEQVNGSLLTISPEEFDEGLRRSKQQVLADTVTTPVIEADERKSESRQDDVATLLSEDPPPPSVLEVRARRLAMMASLE